ncbi:MAG: DUF86 domain-containing protein [Rhodoferax sp.]|nr:DUF86 domain-containing protein [Rhodoferax sp.]
MTDKTPKLLVDALGAIALAQEFVAGCTLDSYTADKMRRSAVERQLEILGEACTRLAKLEPDWVTRVANLKLAIDLRNRIIHGYDSVDDEIVYTTVMEDLPSLQQALNRLLDERG